MRDFLREILEARGPDPITLHSVVSAVDEACANVIEHAYGPEAAGEVALSISVSDAAVAVSIRHRGKGFDPKRVPEPDLSRYAREGRKGGLGLQFMKRFMDRVEYSDLPDGQHEWRLEKRLPAAT